MKIPIFIRWPSQDVQDNPSLYRESRVKESIKYFTQVMLIGKHAKHFKR